MGSDLLFITSLFNLGVFTCRIVFLVLLKAELQYWFCYFCLHFCMGGFYAVCFVLSDRYVLYHLLAFLALTPIMFMLHLA